ncbi:Uu.00g009060.m01.CDS01 [Anthostomella pinea]|uniref:Uu.00g009060.m01.CDS01 n=1 Tax=Anthostomella pinea TaxID=933095 RepID=A0AAI8VXA1_9PEZI|nr:Uu.00g009060.m01.CDS01 [Anthostomella pinea]
MDAAKIAMAETILNYQFQQQLLLWEALQAAGNGVLRVGNRVLAEGNKPLAGIGDKVLGLCAAQDIYAQQGTIAQTNHHVSTLANNETLSQICDGSGLTACVNGNPAQRGVVPPKTKAAAVEAVVGAAYMDGGLPAARIVMTSLNIL